MLTAALVALSALFMTEYGALIVSPVLPALRCLGVSRFVPAAWRVLPV